MKRPCGLTSTDKRGDWFVLQASPGAGRFPCAGLPSAMPPPRLSADWPQHHRNPKEPAMAITKAAPGKTRIGWIGTGVMGRWMCQHAIGKGYQATVYNRSKDKA